MGEIWEQRLLLNMDGAPLHFSKPGLYHLQLRQLMRTNPLPDILSVGIRLEKNTAS